MSDERTVETTGSFRFEMGGVMLGGQTREVYAISRRRWEVTYEAAGRPVTGVGESLTDAYLDLVRIRLGGDEHD